MKVARIEVSLLAIKSEIHINYQLNGSGWQ